MKASCAAAAAVAATAKAYSADKPRSRGEFSSAKPSKDTTPTDPKNFCKQPGNAKKQPCPPPSSKQRGASDKTPGAEVGAGAGAGAKDRPTTGGSDPTRGAGGRASSGAESNVLSINAQIVINFEKDESRRSEVCVPVQEESQKKSEEFQQDQALLSGQAAEAAQAKRASLQPSQQSRESKTTPTSADKKKESKEKAWKSAKEPGQVLAAMRSEMAKQTPRSVGSCVCDGRITPANSSFRSTSARFPTDSPDTRPWYCNTPSFHDSNKPKSPLSPTPSHAPFYQSAARFKPDRSFKSPAPNTYLPPVMHKVRWSGILTGYHGIPTCYNIVDRNCDLSKVHMHCVMCPPRGIYNKSIGLPLNEIYPDAKLRDDQLRHMCSWHAGAIKRAFHDRGMLAKGCTDGLDGRSDVGPPGLKTDNVGCTCIRRCNLGTLDDVTLERMAAALNRKKRDPDLFQPLAVCQKFADKELDTPEGAAAKRAAEECKKRCKEYKKMQKRKEVEEAGQNELPQKAGKTKAPEPQADKTSRPSRKSEAAEPRLASVTENVDESPTHGSEQYAPAVATEESSKRPSESGGSSGTASRKSSGGGISKKQSVVSKKSSDAISQPASCAYPQSPSAVVSRKSSRATAEKCSENASYQDSRCICDKTPPVSMDTGYPETINESSQEGTATESGGLQIRTASDATVRSSSMAEETSASSRRRSVQSKNAHDDMTCQITELDSERQNAAINQDGTGVGDGKCGPGVCPPIKINCKCSLYNKGQQSADGSQHGMQNAPQFGQQGYGPQGGQSAPPGQYDAPGQQYGPQGQVQQYGAQGQRYSAQGQRYSAQSQHYGAQGQQYCTPGQQYGSQGQPSTTYSTRVRLCFPQSEQSAGTNAPQNYPQGQQYASQGQQYASQGQQYASQGQQYAQQGQQYAPQCQQYASQDQQYAPQGQQYSPQCQQYAPQGQQYGQQGQQLRGTVVAKICVPPPGMPPCSPKDPGQSPNSR